VLVTDLHNYGMPFIRYGLGDLAVLDDSACPCGRGLPRIQRIEGRVFDALRTSDGRIVPGEFVAYILKDLSDIAQYRVEQDAPDHLIFYLVLRARLSEKTIDFLRTEIESVFNGKMKWEIREVAEIPKLASGKRRLTVGLAGR